MKKIILINFLIVTIILSFTEVFSRYVLKYAPQGISHNLIRHEENLIFNNKNIQNAKVFGLNVYTDEQGFRVKKERTVENKDKKILFIGGSAVYGAGVKVSDTFVEKLNLQSEYAVKNLGVMGSKTTNNLKILKKFNEKKVEKIFINLSIRDLSDSGNEFEIFNEGRVGNLLSFLKSIEKLKKIKIFLRANTATYPFLKDLFFEVEKKYYLRDIQGYKNDALVNQNKKKLKEFSSFINKVTFFSIPYSAQMTDVNCSSKDIFERIIEKQMSELNFKYINLKKQFCKLKDSNQLYIKGDPAHLSKKGHAAVFNILKNNLN
jgi:hypothetical protein